MTNLVIVESGAKAKTIQKHLESLFPNETFRVVACFGHIRDLPQKEIGIDTSDWSVKYVTLPKKNETIAKLRSAIQDASLIYIASDPDREGEAIAFHVKDTFRIPEKKYKRVTFNEITRTAIQKAFESPRKIDMSLVDAQEARRILDRLVGYELSPLLWHRYCTNSLSAGRVQSTALRMILDRAKEADAHKAVTYWRIHATFAPLDIGTTLRYEKEDVKYENLPEAKQIFDWLMQYKNAAWSVTSDTKTELKHPSPPFITSTLQQEAYSRFGFSSKTTMQVAQVLYELGHITYMRTDSPSLSPTAQNDIIKYITDADTLGKALVKARVYTSKNEHSQEAHECIRPSYPSMLSAHLPTNDKIKEMHRQLYDLIWKRTVASQMIPAEYCVKGYTIGNTKMLPYDFYGHLRRLTKRGYLQVYSPSVEVDADVKDATDTTLRLGDLQCNGDATRGQTLFNEPMLIKMLEKAGVGRPSTYATILEKLVDKKYVYHGQNPQCDISVTNFTWKREDATVQEKETTIHLGGNEKDRFVPTTLGEKVITFLQEVYPSLLDVEFTSNMEAKLDAISEGKTSKADTLHAFFHDFNAAIVQCKSNIETNASEKGAKKKEKSELGPKSELKTFVTHGAAIVNTRYGPALYLKNEKRFVSISSFLTWKEKPYERMTDDDVAFLTRMPLQIANTTREIAMGPYGLYVKDGKTNIPLPRELWNRVYDGTLVANDIQSLANNSTKTSWKPKRQARS